MPRSWLVACGVAAAVAVLPAQASQAIRLAGTIVADHTGLPVSDVTLLVLAAGEKYAARELRTDASGRFDAGDLPSGDYAIETSADGYLDTSLTVPAGTPAGPLAIHLVRYGLVSGQLLAPVEGNVVLVEQVPDGVTPRQVRVRPDEDGRFRLWPVPPGTYLLGVHHPVIDGRLHRGFATMPQGGAPRPVVINGGEALEGEVMQLTAVPTFAVSGHAVSTDGAFDGAVSVRVRRADMPGMFVASRLLRDDRAFLFEDLLPGTYTVEGLENVQGMGPDGERRGQVTVTLLGSDVAIDVPMAVTRAADTSVAETGGAGTLTCALPAENAPPVIATIVMDVTPGRESLVRVTLGGAGADVEFGGLPAGRYYVAARAADDLATRWAALPGLAPQFVDVTSGETTTVSFR